MFVLFRSREISFIDGIMDVKHFVSILTNALEPSAEMMGLDSFIFQKDNDPKHTSRLAKNLFEYKEIELLPWPSQFPDLNLLRIFGL
jgi:hypothetical protein